MRCQECQERPANLRLVRIQNGQKTEQYLCEECARKKGDVDAFVQSQFPFGNLLAGLMGQDWWMRKVVPERQQVSCPECGLTQDEFAGTGLLGCGECYRTFGELIEPILVRVHGQAVHKGKSPRSRKRTLASSSRLEELRARLKELIEREEFEEAARVRDEIKELSREIQDSGEGEG